MSATYRLLPFFLVASWACGTDDASNDSNPQGPGVDAGATPLPAKSGIMHIMSPSVLNAANNWAWGAFSDDPTPSSCSTSTLAGCSHRTCVETNDSDGTLVGAGTMTVAIGDRTFTIEPKSLTKVYAFDGTGLLWTGGEPISLSTIGDVVPAFSMNFVAPEPVVFTSPTFPASAPLGSEPTKMVVDPSQDLALAWEPTGAQTVVARIEWSDSEAKRSDTVRCELSGSAGQGTVPSEVLLAIDPAADPAMWLFTEEGVEQTVDDWSIDVKAISYGTTPASDLAVALLELP